jgi:hypothetical protein
MGVSSSPKGRPMISQRAALLKRKVLTYLTTRNESIFPSKKEPWYQADDEDVRE